MSHQPPVPEGNQSPYPLHPGPTPHSELPPVVARTPKKRAEAGGPGSGLLIGLGVGLIAAGVGLAYLLADTGKANRKKRKKSA
ncbi:hypothetical protein SAMN06297144_2753 [Sphingomonas guangdongensis]|uniref:Uncharacterized protein n=1 Tax=Sphingomonas guangdongensis TaxID=1141890 RepID=A0A285R1H7_9SPHN|nr:hypothetical protein [Sphingomonas guangdongensis]SOB87618.1 hypothetical protein SAMN06297144_2753 [Sphingomonas guangdongensis]